MFNVYSTKMTGTTGSSYKTAFVAESGHAAVGYRDIGGGQFRVRLEAASGNQGSKILAAVVLPGWQKPDSERRFSTVTTNPVDAVTQAVKALKAADKAAQPTVDEKIAAAVAAL